MTRNSVKFRKRLQWSCMQTSVIQARELSNPQSNYAGWWLITKLIWSLINPEITEILSSDIEDSTSTSEWSIIFWINVLALRKAPQKISTAGSQACARGPNSVSVYKFVLKPMSLLNYEHGLSVLPLVWMLGWSQWNTALCVCAYSIWVDESPWYVWPLYQ